MAFSGAILIGVAVFAVVWAYGPQKRFRVVDLVTGEVVSHHWTRRGAWARADRLNWPAKPTANGLRFRFGTERVR